MENQNVDMDKILQRIRKMLAMANDKANINESAVAAGMAQRLMDKYQIDMASVLADPITGYGARDVNSEYDWTGASLPQWCEWLGVAIARLNECELKYSGYGINKGLTFVGVGPDPAVAVELYKYLTGEVKRLAKHLPKREVASFQKGASHEVCARLRELGEARRKQFQATSSGKGLVLHKAGLIAEAYGKFSYGTSKGNVTDYAAYAKGQQAGRGINLSEQITGATKREAIE